MLNKMAETSNIFSSLQTSNKLMMPLDYQIPPPSHSNNVYSNSTSNVIIPKDYSKQQLDQANHQQNFPSSSHQHHRGIDYSVVVEGNRQEIAQPLQLHLHSQRVKQSTNMGDLASQLEETRAKLESMQIESETLRNQNKFLLEKVAVQSLRITSYEQSDALMKKNSEDQRLLLVEHQVLISDLNTAITDKDTQISSLNTEITSLKQQLQQFQQQQQRSPQDEKKSLTNEQSTQQSQITQQRRQPTSPTRQSLQEEQVKKSSKNNHNNNNIVHDQQRAVSSVTQLLRSKKGDVNQSFQQIPSSSQSQSKIPSVSNYFLQKYSDLDPSKSEINNRKQQQQHQNQLSPSNKKNPAGYLVQKSQTGSDSKLSTSAIKNTIQGIKQPMYDQSVNNIEAQNAQQNQLINQYSSLRGSFAYSALSVEPVAKMAIQQRSLGVENMPPNPQQSAMSSTIENQNRNPLTEFTQSQQSEGKKTSSNDRGQPQYVPVAVASSQISDQFASSRHFSSIGSLSNGSNQIIPIAEERSSSNNIGKQYFSNNPPLDSDISEHSTLKQEIEAKKPSSILKAGANRMDTQSSTQSKVDIPFETTFIDRSFSRDVRGSKMISSQGTTAVTPAIQGQSMIRSDNSKRIDFSTRISIDLDLNNQARSKLSTGQTSVSGPSNPLIENFILVAYQNRSTATSMNNSQSNKSFEPEILFQAAQTLTHEAQEQLNSISKLCSSDMTSLRQADSAINRNKSNSTDEEFVLTVRSASSFEKNSRRNTFNNASCSNNDSNQVCRTMNPNQFTYCVCVSTTRKLSDSTDQVIVFCLVTKYALFDFFFDLAEHLVRQFHSTRLSSTSSDPPNPPVHFSQTWVSGPMRQLLNECMRSDRRIEFSSMHNNFLLAGTNGETSYSLQVPSKEICASLEGNWIGVPPFSILSSSQFTSLLFSIFLEETIVLVSSSRMALICAMKPFKWPHPLVVVSNKDLMHLMDSPFPVLLGLHQTEQQVKRDNISSRFPQCQLVFLDNLPCRVPMPQTAITSSLMYADLLQRIKPDFECLVDSIRRNHPAHHIAQLTTLVFAHIRGFFESMIDTILPTTPFIDRNGKLDYDRMKEFVINKQFQSDSFLEKFITTQIFSYFIEEHYQSYLG